MGDLLFFSFLFLSFYSCLPLLFFPFFSCLPLLFFPIFSCLPLLFSKFDPFHTQIIQVDMVLRHIETYWDILRHIETQLFSFLCFHWLDPCSNAPLRLRGRITAPQSFAPRHGAWHSTLELGQEEIASLEVGQFAFQSNVGNGKSPINEGFNWNIPIIISYWFLFYVVLVVWPIPVWLTA